MKYLCILTTVCTMFFLNIAYAIGVNPTPSQAIHAHPLDQYGNWTGEEDRSEFSVGELIEFHNPYKIPLWQLDGWSIKDLQTGKFIGCVPLFSKDAYPQCTMVFADVEKGIYADDSCDDANQKRSFSKAGTYRIGVMSTGPGYCGAPVTYKIITISGTSTEETPTDNLSWLVPVVSLLLN